VSRVNSHGARVKAAIIATGLDLWRADPATVSARKIGQRVGLTHSACLYHFGTAEQLKDAIAREAVRLGDPVIVPQLITARHPTTQFLTPEQRAAFLSHL
jgi:AcrR family transcriptional regulator